MANGNTMWNGNYGSDEQARRDSYDRSDPYPKGVKAAAPPVSGEKARAKYNFDAYGRNLGPKDK